MGFLFFWIFVLATPLTYCYSANNDKVDTQNESKKAASIGQAELATTTRDNTLFGIHLFSLLKQRSDNFVFSPFSISSTFAVIYGGANGETETQMKKGLQFSLTRDVASAAINDLTRSLTSYNRDVNPHFRLSLVNSLWFQSDFPLQAGFLSQLPLDFHERIRFVDFNTEPEAVRSKINRSVLERTYGRISDILPIGMVNKETKLILITGINLKARWQQPFKTQSTHTASFFSDSPPYKTISVAMMENTGRYPILETDSFSLLEMPYAPLYSSPLQLSFFILLPHHKVSPETLEQWLLPNRLKSLVSQMQVQDVHVSIPKFQITDGFNLKDPLKQLGMQVPFTEQADFSKMTDKKLKIDEVFHKAFITIDEWGTEIASAPINSTVAAPSEKQGPIFFQANRPFIFFIMEKSTGTLLLLGQLRNPHSKQ